MVLKRGPDKKSGSDVVSSGTAGLHGSARVRLHERWSFSGDAEGDVGDD